MSKLANGIIFKRKGEKSPDFVKGKVSIKVDEFIQTLKENNNNGWVNLDMLLAKTGNIYFAVNDWKPEQKKPEHPFGQGKTYNQAVKPINIPANVEYPPMPEEEFIDVKNITF